MSAFVRSESDCPQSGRQKIMKKRLDREGAVRPRVPVFRRSAGLPRV